MKKTLAAAALLACLAAPALGHSQRFSDEENDWLNEQQSVNGTKCCDRHDAFVGQDVEWRIRGGHYEVHVDGQWFPILPGQILDIDPANPSPWPGQALLFYSRNPNYRGGLMIWCFMPEPLM